MPSISSLLLLSSSLSFLASAVRIKVDVPATNFLPNPASLPATSRAVLTSKGSPLSVPISRSNSFLFADVPTGSHLLSVYTRDVIFENLRIDVSEAGAVQSWQTFRGNEWSNKGEVRGSGDAGDGIALVQVRAVAKKEYYQLRPSFSIMSLFQNPMILIAIVTLGMVIGVPYMMENMDPEMQKEFKEIQEGNGASVTATTQSIQNMDFADSFASWMAGSKKNDPPAKPEAGIASKNKK